MSTVDVAAVRALAHPLRLQLLDLLRFDGPSTATLLGARLRTSSGATSYHLRQLARYGFIEEAAVRNGRERWWRYRARRIELDGGEEGRELLGELLSREAHALDAYLAQRERVAEWDAASFFASRGLRLTVSELDDLRRELEELLARYRRAEASDAPPDAHPVRLLAFGYPLALAET
jgi:predicted ArsR family transcriptional regulator